jgi:PLP dependent protein
VTSASHVAERLAALRSRLNEAAERAGREPDSFRIVAVTKTFDIGTCRAALQAGLTRLGENRVQEAEPKIAALPQAEWHLVGRLQSNKARRAVRGFAMIHSIDSTDLLARVDRVAAEEDLRPRLLLEVNVSGEQTKAGFEPAELASVRLGAQEAAPVVGLMTILPYGAADDDARRWFRRLRELRDELQDRTGQALPELSMGMSGDAEAAVAEGGTLVRIGTALFGPRRPTLVSSHP